MPVSRNRKLLIVEVRSRGAVFNYRYDLWRAQGYDLFYLTTSAEGDYPFDGYRQVPTREIADFIDVAEAWHEQERFDAIITTDETSVIATAIICQRLGLPGLSVEAARRSRNKLLMREAHRSFGAPHPQFRRCETVDEALEFANRIGFPVIIKPTLGGDSEHVYRVADEETLRRKFVQAQLGNSQHSHRFAEAECEEMGPSTLLVEEYLDGSEHAVEAAIDGDRVVMSSIADRMSVELDVFDNDLYATPTRLSPEQVDDLRDAVLKGAQAQGIERGVVHAELRFHRGRAHIVEIAARPGGGCLQYMAKISYGNCPVLAALRAAEGRPADEYGLHPTGKAAVGLTMLCDEGRVREAVLPADLAQRSEIFTLRILSQAGAVVKRPPNGNDIFGFIGASGDTLQDALDAAHRTAQEVQLVLDPL